MDIPGTHGHRVFTRGFFGNDDLDFLTRIALGRAVSGAADVGEVLATVAQVDGRKDWTPAFTDLATRTEAAAEASAAAGHRVSARDGVQPAASYWASAVSGLTGRRDTVDLLSSFRRHRACWERFVELSAGAHLRVDVPYEGGTLPGWLLRPDATGARRPTLVMNNGSDGAITDMWGSGGAGALARGWNAFVFDGPGQQSLLFERDVPFRPDWEAVLTPVVDTLVQRSDVDPERLTLYGISQAGYWVPRTLAFEHRFAAAVADPGVVDVSTSWTDHLSKGMTRALDNGDRKTFDRDMDLGMKIPGVRDQMTFRSRPYRFGDWFDLFTTVRTYRMTPELAAQITTPLLVTDPEDEQFWPGQSQQLVDLLGDRATRVPFTAAEGANFHCQPMGRGLTDQRMFDWLEDRLP